ncbi:MAG: putative toxin-antitoxin system toxin component, PIN family [Okeania sp. SIO2H7]|nr:putative toxin-antitoxin system toxin component, PIN family [Okeania sp. SIO2H7]
MLKVVLDTSVFVSAILSKSDNAAPRRILNFWYGGEFVLIMTPQLLQELVGVLVRRKIPDEEIEDLVAAIGSIALQIPGAYESTRLDEIDPDDNKFLAAAYEAKADYLVSLDNDLLFLKNFHGTQIRTPALFLDRFESQ